MPISAPSLDIIICKSCGLKVHNYCYGITKTSKPFFCDICQYRETLHPKCLICGNSDKFIKAFKRLERNLWVHVICGLTSNRLLIVDFRSLKMKIMPEEHQKTKAPAYEKCCICGLYSEIKDLWQCDHCSIKAHAICICIEKAFSEKQNDTWWFLWLRFLADPLPYQRLLSITEELFLEECENLRTRFYRCINEYQQNSQQIISEKNHHILEILRALQKKLLKNCIEISNKNRGFLCKDHVKITCKCGSLKVLDSQVYCDYCGIWFHENCLDIPSKEEFVCKDCSVLKSLLPSVFEIFSSQGLLQIKKLTEFMKKMIGKYLKPLDLMILGVLYEDLLEHMDSRDLGIESTMRSLSEFFVHMPINLGCRLMTPMQNYLKKNYWEEYLLGNEFDFVPLVRSCLNLKGGFDDIAHEDLKILLSNMRNLEQEVIGVEAKFKNSKLRVLEEIWRAQITIKIMLKGQKILPEELEILKETAKKFPQIEEFKLMIDFWFDKQIVGEELKIMLDEMENGQKMIKQLISNTPNIFNLEIIESFNRGRWSEIQVLEILQKISKYNQYGLEVKWIEKWHQGIQFEIKELENLQNVFQKEAQLDPKIFEGLARKSLCIKIYNENSLEICQLWKRWKLWEQNLTRFEACRKEIRLEKFIWKDQECELIHCDYPLLYLSQSIKMIDEPFLADSSIYELLSMDAIKSFLDEGLNLQIHLPFLDSKNLALKFLYQESQELQNILEKIYKENMLNISLKGLWQRLQFLNIYLPIFGKIRSFGNKPNEMIRLSCPQNYLSKTFQEIEMLMVKALNPDCLLELDELFKGGRLQKRLKRLLGCKTFENPKPWINFLKDIRDNIRLFKRIYLFFAEFGGDTPKTPNQMLFFIEEKLKDFKYPTKVFPENDNFLGFESSIHDSKLNFSEDLLKETTDFLNLFQNYQNFDQNSNIKILLKGFAEILLENRWFFWLFNLKKSFLQDKLSLEDFLDLREYLSRFLESLGISTLKNRSEYLMFKNIERAFEEWIKEYQEILRILIEDQETARLLLDDLIQKISSLLEHMPLRIKCLELHLNELYLGMQAALKAKKTLFLMNVERKELAFSCIETLSEFFEAQNPNLSLPFSQEIIAKFLEIKTLKSKINEIQKFLSKKTELFRPFALKISDVRALKSPNNNTTALYIIKPSHLSKNPHNIYNFFEESLNYKELINLIDKIKMSGVNFKSERIFLGDLKKNCEAFMRSFDRIFEKNPFDSFSQRNSPQFVDDYLYKILSNRNKLLTVPLIKCHGFYELRHYEWAFYVLCTLSGQFWLLKETTDYEMIIEKIQVLKAFDLEENECISTVFSLNERSEIEIFYIEGVKIKEFGSFPKEFNEVFENLVREIEKYDEWAMRDFKEFKKQYEFFQEILKKYDEINEFSIEIELKTIVRDLLSKKFFEGEVLEFLYTRVREYQETRSFWFRIRDLKILNGVSLSMIKGFFWVKELNDKQFLRVLLKALELIKKLYRRFLAKKTHNRFLRLLKVYKSCGLLLPEIEALRDEVGKSCELTDELYREFRRNLRMENYLEIWGRLSMLKKRLKDDIPLKFSAKYQSFWLEILESQILCLKSLWLQGTGVNKSSVAGSIAMNSVLGNPSIDSIGNNNINSSGNNNNLSQKLFIALNELKEIEKESHGLSKPSRDFLEDFLKKCQKPKALLKKFPWIKSLLDLSFAENYKENTPMLKLIQFKRIRNIFYLKEALEKLNKFSKKKMNHLAEFLENKAFRTVKKDCPKKYEKNIEEILVKLQKSDEDVMKMLKVNVGMKDGEVIDALKKGFESFLIIKHFNIK